MKKAYSKGLTAEQLRAKSKSRDEAARKKAKRARAEVEQILPPMLRLPNDAEWERAAEYVVAGLLPKDRTTVRRHLATMTLGAAQVIAREARLLADQDPRFGGGALKIPLSHEDRIALCETWLDAQKFDVTPPATATAPASTPTKNPAEETALAKLGSANRMLAEVHDAPTAKRVIDLAAAAELFARKAKLGEEAVRLASGIKLDAERKLGTYLQQQPKATGTRGQLRGRDKPSGGSAKVPPDKSGPTLAELGISKKLSSEAQRLATLDDDTFAAVKTRGDFTAAAAAELAKLPKAKRLEIAESSKPIRAGNIRAIARQVEKSATIAKINKQQVQPLPTGPFGVIAVDFPWPYDNSDNHEGSRGHVTYPTMPLDEIANYTRVFDDIAANDCILFAWFTNAFIHELGGLLYRWKFEHRTLITWDKGRIGLGSWGRGRTEHFVIASRGKPTHTLNRISTLLSAPAREHSRKPEAFYELVENNTAGPFVELFAREQRKGWASWGAEVGKFKEAEAA